MAAVAIGPCIVVAPLVFLAVLLAIPLWPVAILCLAVLWSLAWVYERACGVFGVRICGGAAAAVARWLRVVARPWTLFEPSPQLPVTAEPIAQPEDHS